uniref:Uncharacterized protein n=1 Tax=Oryza glaberrima TaxID=4538 RepID=I1R575_ORYGL
PHPPGRRLLLPPRRVLPLCPRRARRCVPAPRPAGLGEEARCGCRRRLPPGGAPRRGAPRQRRQVRRRAVIRQGGRGDGRGVPPLPRRQHPAIGDAPRARPHRVRRLLPLRRHCAPAADHAAAV